MVVDLLEYIRGDGRIYEMKYELGETPQTVLYQTQGDSSNSGIFYQVKDQQWERWYADDNYLYREADTSESADGYLIYSTEANPGAVWSKRFLALNESFTRNPLLIYYLKRDCSERTRRKHKISVQVAGIESTHTFPSGVKLNDLLVLNSILETQEVVVRAFYAKGFGLVGWETSYGQRAYLTRTLSNHPVLEMEKIWCLNRPKRLFFQKKLTEYVRIVSDQGDAPIHSVTNAVQRREANTIFGYAKPGSVFQLIALNNISSRIVLFNSEEYFGGQVAGYVESRFIEPASAADLQESMVASGIDSQKDYVQVIPMKENLNIRTDPVVYKYTVIAQAEPGTIFEVERQIGEWILVVIRRDNRYANRLLRGFVHRDFVRYLPKKHTENQMKVINLVMQLPKHPTQSYGKRDLRLIEFHAIHHTATQRNITPEQVANYHISLGWPGIGYTFFIASDGTIYQTNELNTMSYATRNENHRVISTVLAGNFVDGELPTPAQLQSARWLHHLYLRQAIGRKLSLKGHKEIPGQQTSCPGTDWDWHELIENQLP